MGWWIDRYHVTTVILISTVGATISVFLVWGLSSNLPLLVVFSVLYGFFGGGFVVTYTGVLKLVKGKYQTADTGILIGILCAGRGIASLVCGPVSEALVSGSEGGGYGRGFGPLIVFTGVTTALGGLGFLWKKMGLIR